VPEDRYTGNLLDPLIIQQNRDRYLSNDTTESWTGTTGSIAGGGFFWLLVVAAAGVIMAAVLLLWEFGKWLLRSLRNKEGASFYFSIVFLIIVGSLVATPALAEINENNMIDTIVNDFRGAVGNWSAPILLAATWIFWALALLEFTWTGMGLALRGADYSEVVMEFITRVIFIGFFWMLLLNGPAWAQAIIWSLADIAGNASVAGGAAGNTNAADVFDTGLELASRMIDDVSFWDSGTEALGIWFGSVIVMFCFALMTAMLILTMVETYIVVQAAVILLGFGPTRWTKDYAIRYLIYAVATGMKWFVLLLIVGIGEIMMNRWLNQYENNDTQVLLIVGAAVVLLALVKNLPDMMQSILTGVSIGMGQNAVAAAQQTVNSTRMAGAAAARIASGAVGAGRAATAATQLSRAQGNKGVGIVSGAMKNLASGIASEAGGKAAKGRYAGPASGAGHRISDNMKQKIAALRSEGSMSKGS